jgi:hypothetical protein
MYKTVVSDDHFSLAEIDEDDVLIVTKMDRLGRNAIDVKATIDRLTGMHVRVHCLQLGGADLTSATTRRPDSVEFVESSVIDFAPATGADSDEVCGAQCWFQ